MLQTKQWFDDSGSYVPLSDRQIRDSDVFGRIFKDMDHVVEYDQVGSALFVYTDSNPETIRSKLESEHGGIRATIRDRGQHTYRYIDTDNYVIIDFTAK